MAGLAGVGEAALDVPAGSLFQVAIGQDDVRRLAAQFQADALDGPSRRLAHLDPRAGRSGERDHVDVGVERQGIAHDAAAADDQVEDAGRRARLIHHLGQGHARGGRGVRRLQHHRAAGGDAVDHLDDGGLDRPVPWRDQCADADGLAPDDGVGQLLFEGISADQVAGDLHVPGRAGDLRLQRDGHAHLLRDQLGQVRLAALIGGDDAVDQRDALVDRCLREAREGALGCGHGAVDIGHTAPRGHGGPGLLGRRVDQGPRPFASGRDPLAVDVQLSEMFTSCLHASSGAVNFLM